MFYLLFVNELLASSTLWTRILCDIMHESVVMDIVVVITIATVDVVKITTQYQKFNSSFNRCFLNTEKLQCIYIHQ